MQVELDQIDAEIQEISREISQTPKGDPNMALLLIRFANSHNKRFGLRREPNDIQKVIEYRSSALALTPSGDLGLPDMLSELGIAHSKRFERLGDKNDLEKAIEWQTRALELIPEGHANLPRQLSILAMIQTERFDRFGEPGDIEQAIKHHSMAVEKTPEGHPSLPAWLGRLGMSYRSRFQRFGRVKDLESAIEYHSRALALTPEDHPSLSIRLFHLATSHGVRFKRWGEPRDLDQAIEYQSRALALTPDGHPGLSTHLCNLAVSHSHRFERLGDLSDLEEAIGYQSRALSLTPDDDPNLSSNLSNLSVFHSYRFGRLGERSDLEQAIKYDRRALALTPNDHPALSGRLANLSVSHSDRFKLLGELKDLEQAIEYKTRALALTGDDHPLLVTHLANLAVSHKDRFQHLGELSDLKQAISYGSRALTLTPDDHPDLPIRLANLAGYHQYRFQLLGDISDLEQTIEYESRTLAKINPDHPHWCLCHFNHALSYVTYYNYSHDSSNLLQALPLFRNACASSTGLPRDRFRHALRWASHASKHSELNPIEAYQATIDLLPQFIWLGATADQRYHDVKSMESLPLDAAHTAILSSDYSLALEWLEHARCVVWSQNLMLRSPLDQLHGSHLDLATRLQTVADHLHTAGLSSREVQAFSRSITSEQVGQEHRRLAKEYELLLGQARAQPGFEEFLRPIKINRLKNASRNGPIVVLNCHHERCDALLVLPKQANISHLPLPNFDWHKAQAARLQLQMSVESLRLSERGAHRRPMSETGQELEFENVLAALWYDVVKPVLDYLEYTKNDPTDILPHITWCPTGPMTFLPLHAAGDYDQPRSRVFDYVVSSYTPTLTALLESTPQSICVDSRVLAVAQPATPGHAPLPGTSLELDFLKAHMQGKAEYTQLIDQQATVMAVLDQMERHDWVHLACHAHQNVDDPKKSGFFLSDGVLDLDEINRRSLKGKGLAFLSACQTATGDKTLPDEAVHLASGMLMAGYSSVIATMWSVGDADAPFVADKVYGQLTRAGTLGNGEAGRALHHAVGELRERVGENEFGRWVPFIHIGS